VRSRRTVVAATIAVLATASLAACGSGDEEAAVRSAAQSFLDAWSSENFGAAAAATDLPEGPRQWLPGLGGQLGATGVRFALGSATLDGDKNATQRFTAAWTLPGQDKRWSYGSEMALVKNDDRWSVHWDPSVIHPELNAGLRFRVERVLPPRAAILDKAGQPLFTQTKVVTVGIEPRKVPNLDSVAATLASKLKDSDVVAADIVKAVKAAKPDAFVPVVTLREPEYQKVKAAIYDLPGAVFRPGERLLPPTPTFGQPMLGKVGDATAEILKEAGPAYAAGDTLGLSGLQRAFNKQLAGVPSVRISLIDSAAKPVRQLADFKGHPGENLRTTIDRPVQIAAEAALAGVQQAAAIVAVKPSTGEILAVANSAKAPFNIALEGKYPPGSTFKIVTATALLQSGAVAGTSPVPCPGSITVGGKRFVNHDEFDEGTIPLSRAFALSCNTTFLGLASRLPQDALANTAANYGIGSGWKLPVPAFTGSVPPPRDAAEQAADAIGQGTVLVSPFSMAMAAATVARGTLPSPTLIAGQPVTSASAPAQTGAATVKTMQELTRAVVTEGTATVLKTAGPAVAGKTGTAEYGTDTPPRSHAWFVGFRGDLAFAVLVVDGQSSHKTAVPVAKAFLTGF
jgi:cell division protein FtsI/penicillin-binding protein 2